MLKVFVTINFLLSQKSSLHLHLQAAFSQDFFCQFDLSKCIVANKLFKFVNKNSTNVKSATGISINAIC